MPAPFWNPKRDERLRKLREAGKENQAIAKAMGIHESSVARRATELKLPKRERVSKYWNDARDAELKELWAQVPKLSLSAIRDKLGGGVSKAYVSARASKLDLTARYKSVAGLAGEATGAPDASRMRKRKVYQSRDTRLYGVPDDVVVRGKKESDLNLIVTAALKPKRAAPCITYATGATADRTLAIGDGTTAYTLVGSELYANGTTNDANLRVAYKRMGSTPDANVVLGPSGNAADGAGYAVHVWRNVDAVTPLDVTPTTATGTATSRPNPPSITPTTPGAVVIAATAGAAATGTTAFAFTGASNLVQDNGADTQDGRASLASYAWTSGALDPAASSAGSNNAADSWVAISFALRPAVQEAGGSFVAPKFESYNRSTDAAPSGVVAGDLLLAFCSISWGAERSITTPSGWTLIASSRAMDTGGFQMYAFYRWATGSDTYAFAAAGSDSWTIERWSGVDPAEPIAAFNTSKFDSWAATGPRTNPGVTTTRDKSVIVWATHGHDAPTAPGDFTLINTWGDYDLYALALRREQETAGASGTLSHVAANSIWVTIAVALNPAST